MLAARQGFEAGQAQRGEVVDRLERRGQLALADRVAQIGPPQALVTANVLHTNKLAGMPSMASRSGPFMPTSTLSGYLVRGSGFILSEGFVLSEVFHPQ